MRWMHTAGRGLLVLVVIMTGYVTSGARAGDGPPGGRGPLTLATAGDLTGYLGPLLKGWNRTHPGERVTLVELPDSADETHAQMTTDLRGGDRGRFDVLNIDVDWTSEFAAAGWIRPLPRDRFPLGSFLPPVVDTATYEGRLYAVPYVTNAGLLLYRRDVLDREGVPPPRTWAELERDARTIAPKYGLDGYAGQFLPYEGLTVNAAEAVYSAGGTILGGEGRRVTVDSAAAREGIGFLARGIREGWIPKRAPDVQGGGVQAVLPGRQAALPAQLALRLRRRLGEGHEGGRADRRRSAAGARRAGDQRPRRIQPRRQLPHPASRFRRASDRVPHQRARPAPGADAGRTAARARRALRGPRAGAAVPVPADPAHRRPHRPSAPQEPALRPGQPGRAGGRAGRAHRAADAGGRPCAGWRANSTPSPAASYLLSNATITTVFTLR
ncbi:hypothetical protein GCM10017687_18640 [Streptomyces echinatus]